MFEFLFKYPAAAFAKGKLVLLASWPAWLLPVAIVLGALLLLVPFWRAAQNGQAMGWRRSAIVCGLQAGFVAVLLLMLWQPALSVSTLRPQQNIVAVVVDDSRSMSARDANGTRRDEAVRLLDSGLLDRLRERFQVRLYRASDRLERIGRAEQLQGQGSSTRLAGALRELAGEAASLPVGAILLISDGADNAGGLDLETVNAVRRQQIPVHTVGVGRERLDRDIEIASVEVPARAIAESRVPVQVGVRNYGYKDRKVRLTIREGSRVLASRDVELRKEAAVESFGILANVGTAGAKTLHIGVDPLGGEENTANNAVDRLVTVDGRKPRILYIEGEPRWELKFIRRAAEEDPQLELISMVRTTPNKVYRQGVKDAAELSQGFPATVEELFSYQGLILGGVEAAYFTPAQLDLIRQFADRRSGGILFLGGRSGLGDGGWGQSAIADVLPVTLAARRDTFRRDPANVELTGAGIDSVICRLDDDPARNAERWRRMPFLANYQDPGTPKSGAVTLIESQPVSRGRMPLLVTQNFGYGRTAVLATAGTWRWQMAQPLEDKSHEMFWQQLLRWLVAGSFERVAAASDRSVYADETRVRVTASVRDTAFAPAADARVEARIMGPNSFTETVALRPDPAAPGTYVAETAAPAAGTYIAEVSAYRGEQEAGRDVVTFLRQDGVAENFHTEQNRELLEKLAANTGGRYYTAAQAGAIPEQISLSEAGISTRETRELWNMPFLFLLALGLRSSEWALRRKWGAV